MSRYLRFAALGDSTTFGIGDPVPGGPWALRAALGLPATNEAPAAPPELAAPAAR